MDKDIIKLKNITYTYPESKKAAVNDITLNIKEGSWTTIVGHNGSGKSTITRLINGLLVPDQAPNSEIVVDGIKLTDETVWQIRDKVGIVFQNPDNQFVGATVADDVAFGLENRGVPRPEMIKIINNAIAEVGMTDFKNAEPSNLSGGQKQRIAIAGIIAIKPKVIILDEATSMLDPVGRQHIISLVKKMKKRDHLTVISITHEINEIEFADQVVIINDGKIIAQSTPNEIFQNINIIKETGLEEPFVFKLSSKLRHAGIPVSKHINNQEELIKELWQLNSKM